MKLNAKERLVLVGLLPQKGTILTQIMVRDIAEKVKLTDDETTSIGLKTEIEKGGEGRLRFDPEKSENLIKEIAFASSEIELLKTIVTDLDNAKGISRNNLDVCLKIKECETKKKTD